MSCDFYIFWRKAPNDKPIAPLRLESHNIFGDPLSLLPNPFCKQKLAFDNLVKRVENLSFGYDFSQRF